ncbi:hypothetical protein IAT38_004200 [Cryptococcus sp. DSM 104549]
MTSTSNSTKKRKNDQVELDKGKATRKKTYDFHPDYCSHDADVVLVSSDEKAFKVHSYQLKTASTVFCDMLQLGADLEPTEIRLIDKKIESSKTIAFFLDILCGKDLESHVFPNGPGGIRANFDLCENVMAFMDKYDMPAALRTLRHVVDQWHHRKVL